MKNLSKEIVIEQFEVGPVANFSYLIGSAETRQVVLVDPAWDIDKLLSFVDENDYQLVGAIATHCHPDHIGGSMYGYEIAGVAELLERRSMTVYAHKLDADLTKEITGISESDIVKTQSGDYLDLGPLRVEFLHTPGHTPGSQCLKISNLLVSGDTLFIDCCGRVDLPGSDPDEMFQSIKKIESLPDETVVLPGHNYSPVPKATLAEVKKLNSVCCIRDLETWRQIMSTS